MFLINPRKEYHIIFETLPRRKEDFRKGWRIKDEKDRKEGMKFQYHSNIPMNTGHEHWAPHSKMS